MSSNVLITGAAGYIGGSLVADFLASNSLIGKQNIIAAVRSDDQVKALSKLGISVVKLDLSDEKAVTESLLQHKINIVIQTASSINPGFSLPLITALGKQKEISGQETYFIHSSGLSAFYERTGWPSGQHYDTGSIFDTEKQLADSFPIRKTDVAVIEHAKASGVTSFVVVPCTVYGKGTGEWNKLSVVYPAYVKASITGKKVHKFEENTKVSGVHISDLTALYGLIVEKILRKEPIASGNEGYYFALAHHTYWWEVLDHLAAALKARGILADPTLQLWPSDKAAAEALGVPVEFVPALWKSGANMVAERPFSIGWKPQWNYERFLSNIDDEIDAVLELDKPKSSLIDSLFAAARG